MFRFKVANTSIKIDFYHIPVNESIPNKLGYLLLSLKEAQIIDPSSNDRVNNILCSICK